MLREAGLTRQELLKGAAGGLLILSVPGCSSDDKETGSKPRSGGVLQIAISDVAESELLDPLQSLNQNNGLYAGIPWELLVEADNSWKPKLVLAESIEPNADASEWRIKVRRDVKWHDGKRLEAADVAWTLRRHLDEQNGSPFFGRVSASLEPDGLSTPKADLLVCRLKRPDSIFPLVFRTHGMQIVQDGWEPDGKARNAVGTGSFRLTEWTAGGGWAMERYGPYWRGAPRLDGIRGVAIPDQSNKLQSVLNGESHYSDGIDPAQLETVTASGSVEIVNEPQLLHTYLVMDTTQQPFDDPNVRKAFKLAADRQRIMEVAFRNKGGVGGDCVTPVGSVFFPPDLKRDQDVEQAKSLLSRAGHGGGIDMELVSAGIAGGVTDMVLAFKETVKDAGIDLNIRQTPVETYFEDIFLKERFYVDYLQHDHPINALELSFTTRAAWNETKLKDPRMDRFVESALAEIDEGRRAEIIREAMRFQADNEGLISLAFPDRLRAKKSAVQGLRLRFAQGADLSKVWLGT